MYKKLLVLAKTKFVARLLASDFPSENPRTQASNFPYTKRWQTYKTKKPKKIMIKILTSSMFLFFLTVNLTFGQNDPLLDFINKNKDKSPGNPISVSAIQLISTPEKYDGKVIRVIGYLNLEFEGTALYCYKSDFENRIYKNSIWLEIPKKGIYELGKQCNGNYVSIIGTFNAQQNGHFGLFSGSIVEIRRIDLRE